MTPAYWGTLSTYSPFPQDPKTPYLLWPCHEPANSRRDALELWPRPSIKTSSAFFLCNFQLWCPHWVEHLSKRACPWGSHSVMFSSVVRESKPDCLNLIDNPKFSFFRLRIVEFLFYCLLPIYPLIVARKHGDSHRVFQQEPLSAAFPVNRHCLEKPSAFPALLRAISLNVHRQMTNIFFI